MSTTIESVLHENRVFNPSPEFVAQANVSGMDAYKALCAEAEADYAGYWGRLAREHVVWKQPFTTVLDESNAPFYKWFADGKLNVSYNCLDKNVEAGLGDKVAIIFEADDGAGHQGHLQGTAGARRQVRQCAEARRASRRATGSSSTCPCRSRASSRCRPAPASAPSTRWCSAASPRNRCATASRMPARC